MKDIKNLSKNELKRYKKNLEKIYSEEIDDIYKGAIYQIDLDDNHIHFTGNQEADNNKIFKDSNINEILEHASFKKVKDVIYYKSKFSNGGHYEAVRELITRCELPSVIIHSNSSYKMFNKIVSNDTIIPVFFYDNECYIDEYDIMYYIRSGTRAKSKDLEEYMEYNLNPDNYKVNSEYFDARSELEKKLVSIYKKAEEDYFKFMESRDYSEEYKMKRLKEKYKKYF